MSDGGHPLAPGLILRRVELVLALTGLILIAAGAKCEGAGDEFFLRERIGYFARYPASLPISNIYAEYHKNVLAHRDSKLVSTDINDWRLARPTGKVCLEFLQQLQVDKFLMDKPHEIIIIDACLDWLFGPEGQTGREYDAKSFSKRQKTQLSKFKENNHFRMIYENTKFKGQEISGELLEDISSYLLKLLDIHGRNADKGCHGEWLEAYNNFLEDVYMRGCDTLQDCQFYGLEGGRDDTYLKMLAEATIAASKRCYAVIQKQIPYLLQAEYKKPRLRDATKSVMSRIIKSAAVRQQAREQWTREIMQVLQIAQGVDRDDRVDLGEIAVKLEKMKEGDEAVTRDFLDRIATYADSNVDLSNSADDFNGRKRYGMILGSLCRPFVDYDEFLDVAGGINTDDQDTALPFDFFKIIYSLVRLANHEEVIGISMSQFEEDVISEHWEALYLATFACQIVFNSFGQLNSLTNKLKYRVELNPDALDMLEMWPIEVLSAKLLTLENSKPVSKLSSPKKRLGGRKVRKYKLMPSVDHNSEARAPSAPSSPTGASSVGTNQSGAASRVLDEANLKLMMTLKKTFPLSTTDEWFQVYPDLVWCLPTELRLKYMNTRTLNAELAEKRAKFEKITPVPCTFLGTKAPEPTP